MRSDNAHFRSLNAAIAKMQSEDYQTHERGAQMYNAGLEGSRQDTDEKASKKVYGKDGKVLYTSLANLRRSLNKKNKKVAESVEAVDEYTELLESVLLALCEELELDPNALLEGRMVAKKTTKKTTKKKTPRPIIKEPNGERTGKPDKTPGHGWGGQHNDDYDGGRGGA